MTKGIIDDLEPVEIDEEKRTGRVLLTRTREQLVQRVMKMGAIGKAGQRIEVSQLPDLGLRLATAHHVHGNSTETDEFVQVIEQRVAGHEIGRASCRERVCQYV